MQLAVALAAILGAATGLPTPEMVMALAIVTLLTTIVSGRRLPRGVHAARARDLMSDEAADARRATQGARHLRELSHRAQPGAGGAPAARRGRTRRRAPPGSPVRTPRASRTCCRRCARPSRPASAPPICRSRPCCRSVPATLDGAETLDVACYDDVQVDRRPRRLGAAPVFVVAARAGARCDAAVRGARESGARRLRARRTSSRGWRHRRCSRCANSTTRSRSRR